jgi:hypothetical protein
MTTSTSSGTQTVTQKYFTGIRFTRETDFFGGDIVLGDVEFDIEHDWNNLFHSTILPVIDTEGEYVTVELKQNGTTVFLGVIQSESISIKVWNDSGDFATPKVSVSFRSILYTRLLEFMSVQEVYDQIISDSIYYSEMPVGLTTRYRVCTIQKMFDAIFDRLYTNSGITTNFSISNSIPYLFNTYTDYDVNASSPSKTENYALYTGDTKYPAISQRSILEVVIIVSATFDSGVSYSRTGMFDDTTTPYSDASDIIKSFVKDLGLVLRFDAVSSSELNIVLSERKVGSTKTLSDIITYSESAYSELNKDSLEVRSAISANVYQERYSNYNGAKFQHTVKNDTGLQNNTKGLFLPSIGAVSGKYYTMMVGSILRGNNGIVNNLFQSDISNWTATAGTWSWDASPPVGITPFGALKGLTEATPIQIKADITSEYQTNKVNRLMFGCYIYFESISSVTLDIMFLDDSSLAISTQSYAITNLSSHAGKWLYLNGGITDRNQTYGQDRGQYITMGWGAYLKYIMLKVTSNQTGKKVYVAYPFLRKYSDDTIEHCGRVVGGYFSPSNKRKKNIECHGVQDVNITDNIEINGQVNYVKRVSIDYMNNKTEIEAINYQ